MACCKKVKKKKKERKNKEKKVVENKLAKVKRKWLDTPSFLKQCTNQGATATVFE